MNVFSIVLKIAEIDHTYGRYCSLSAVYFIIENGIIDRIELASQANYYKLETTDGQIFDISSLNCKTYAELLVAIDVHNLNHNVAR